MRRAAALAWFLLGATVLAGADQISVYEEALPTTLNPLFARTMVDRRAHELAFDRMYFRSAITSELRSRIVASEEPVDNGMAIKLTLKDGITWHDGRPLTSTDVCFTVDAMLDPKTPSSVAEGFRDVLAGCETQKQNIAVIQFKRRFHNPKDRLSFHVLPAHSFASTAVSPDSDFSARPNGTGPMKATQGSRMAQFSKVGNAHHNARIAKLGLSEGGDPLIQVKTILNAGVDGIISVGPSRRLEVSASDNTVLKAYDLRSWWYVAVNTNKPTLNNRLVRQALNLAIDREELRTLTMGIDPEDPLPPCQFISGPFIPASPYYNRGVVPTKRSDLPRVKQLMQEAGAELQANRWVVDGEPLELRVGMDSRLNLEAEDLLNQLANQLQANGFGNRVERIATDQWNTRVVTGQMANDYDLLIGKWSFGVVEDVNALFETRSTGRGMLNIFDYSDPKVDAFLAEFDGARTDTAAQDAYHGLHEYLAEDLPYLFLWKLDTKSAWRMSVRNNTISPYYYFTEFDGWQVGG